MRFTGIRVAAILCLTMTASVYAADFERVYCDGTKSETGDGGDFYGIEFVRMSNGSYKFHSYSYALQSGDPGHPRHRPYGKFVNAEFKCTFNADTNASGDAMSCSLGTHQDCVAIAVDYLLPNVPQYWIITRPFCNYLVGEYSFQNDGCTFK